MYIKIIITNVHVFFFLSGAYSKIKMSQQKNLNIFKLLFCENLEKLSLNVSILQMQKDISTIDFFFKYLFIQNVL